MHKAESRGLKSLRPFALHFIFFTYATNQKPREVNMKVSEHCLSCNALLYSHRTHHETYQGLYGDELIPLCDSCLEFPDNMQIEPMTKAVFNLETSDYEKSRLMTALTKNLRRYKNPKPVIIGLLFTELHKTGGKVLAGRRAIKPYLGEWALISGYQEESHGGWRGCLAAEAFEEVQVVLSADNANLVYPFTFDNNPKGNLMLNFAVARPAAISLGVFKPNKETSERAEIPFSEHDRPNFGIPVHTLVFDQFCQRHFGWPVRYP